MTERANGEIDARNEETRVGPAADLDGDSRVRIDLHCHSEASADCRTPLKAILLHCLAQGIEVQAITDHNEIWGATKLQRLAEEGGAPLTVIVGEEISSADGEIIGLFLKEKIPPGLSAEQTVDEIHGQGGLVLLPHGFDPLKRYRLTPAARARIEHEIDIVEGFNARVSRPRWNREAVSWAQARSLPISAGTDAHTLADVASAWTETRPLRPIRDPESLLEALQRAEISGRWTHPALAFWLKMWREFRGRFGASDPTYPSG